jgi:hypothetical protein
MGAVCAMVYLFTIITFIPWPFYKDIVVATSGGGNRDVIKELEEVETGRSLHRFPHNKVPLPAPDQASIPPDPSSSLRRTCLPSSRCRPSFC